MRTFQLGANIFLSNNSIKLGDFGSPEVVLKQEMGRPLDIWSVGCVVVEMATGKVTPSGHSPYVVCVSWSPAWKACNVDICAKKFLTDHDDIVITDLQCTGIQKRRNKVLEYLNSVVIKIRGKTTLVLSPSFGVLGVLSWRWPLER